jgi:hypothetical protein
MNTKKNTSLLLLIIGVLVLALAGCIGYIVGDFNSGTPKTQPISSNDQVMQEIEELKAMYDSKIAEKTNTFKDLKDQKTKVEALMYELEKTKSDANALVKYKTQYQQLESKMHVLVTEIVALKSGKSNAVTKVKSTRLIDNNESVKTTTFSKNESTSLKTNDVKNSKKQNGKTSVINQPEIAEENTDVIPEKIQPKEVTKIEDYKVSSVKVTGFSIKSSGKQEETESANKVKLIKINFAVSGYSGTNQDTKTYYIQIINSKNNVMGKKITEFFGDKSLTYSFSKSVDLSEGTVMVNQDVYDANFEKGTYFINIFDKSKLVGNSSITLK